MGRKHYQELGEICGTPMTGIHRQDNQIYEMSTGDQMVFLESLARLTCQSIEDLWNDTDSDLDLYELRKFEADLKKYKQAHLLYDFTDMLQKYYEEGQRPELDLLVVDEAQDLCRLQWNIVNVLSENAKKTYIAGDDDQAIFRWSGADIDYFLSLAKECKTEVLSKSYRLPKSVHQVSDRLIKDVLMRNDKHFSPKDEEGMVEYITTLEELDMDKGQWLILVRNGWLISDIVETIKNMGYFYETTYHSVKDELPLKAALLWERLRTGVAITVEQAKNILKFTRKDIKLVKKNNEKITKEEFLEMAGLPDVIWHEALNNMDIEDREYYIAARRKGETLKNGPRIKISTIHGAKGGEAENVVLFTDMSLRTYKGMEQNFDDEIRVFYVGMTRAKQNLYIVMPQTKNYFEV